MACFLQSLMHFSGVLKDDFKATAGKEPAKDQYIVQKDMTKAFDFASKACELNNMFGCAYLSQMYERGDGTKKNEKKAEQFKIQF